MYVCMYVCMHACMHARMYVNLHICACVSDCTSMMYIDKFDVCHGRKFVTSVQDINLAINSVWQVQSNSCLESMSQGAQKAKIPPKRAEGENATGHFKKTGKPIEKFTLATLTWRTNVTEFYYYGPCGPWSLYPLALAHTRTSVNWWSCESCVAYLWSSLCWMRAQNHPPNPHHRDTWLNYLPPWPFWHCVLQVDFAGILPGGFEQLAAKASSVHSRVSRG